MEENKKKKDYLNIVLIALGAIVLIVGGFVAYKLLSKNEERTVDNNINEKNSDNDNTESKITPIIYEVTRSDSNNKMYLFGSIHVANSSDLDFPDYILNAYNNSHYLACEYDIVAYNSNTEKALSDAMNMLYQDGTTIKDHLSDETYQKLVNFLTQKKSYINMYDMYKSYFFISLLSNLMANDAKLSATAGIDEYFLNKAYKDKKTILEVESYDEQIQVFEELSDIFYELAINDSIDNYDESVSNLQKLYDAWKKGNIDDLITYGEDDYELLDSYTEEQKKSIEQYNKSLIDDRNITMTTKAIEYFNANKDVFYMVGTLHIIGDNGIAKNLEQKGFTVKLINK